MKPCKRRLAAGIFATGLLAMYGVAAAGPAPRASCGANMVRGTYGIQLSGHRPAPGGTETVIGIVVRHYDGEGGIQQWDNVKGEITGYVPSRFGTGTYKVNDDCTVDMEFHPGPGITIVERGVIVDGGNEIRTITVVPAGVMVTATHIRI